MRLIATILAGSWRSLPSAPVSLSADDLTRLAPRLHTLGVAPLAWWRLRHSALRDHPAMPALRDDFLHSTGRSAVMKQLMVNGLHALDQAGVDPLLAKGWLAARCYAEPGLRPYGDIDLSVPEECRETALAALERVERFHFLFDIQPGFHGRIDRTAAALDARAVRVDIRGVSVRALAPEDHLRLLACHALGDGVRVPVPLVDLAAVLDTLPPTFDWEYCLSGSPRRTEYLLLALALAGELVGAPLDRVPERWRPGPAPAWVVSTVLDEWRRSLAHPEGAGWLSDHLRRGSLVTAFRLRWPNPVRAAVRCEAPIGRQPRLRWQIRYWVGAGIARRWRAARPILAAHRWRAGAAR
jgi:hypothetical protein